MVLRVVPKYNMKQFVFTSLPMATLTLNFDRIFSLAYSVSLFTDWTDPLSVNQVRIKALDSLSAAPIDHSALAGAKLSHTHLHPVERLNAENCTEGTGISGPWYERLPHFRIGFTPSVGEELQSEYFVPRFSLTSNPKTSNLKTSNPKP